MKFKYGANVGERIGFTNALGDDGLAIEMLDVPTSDVPSVPNMIYAGMIDDHHRFSIDYVTGPACGMDSSHSSHASNFNSIILGINGIIRVHLRSDKAYFILVVSGPGVSGYSDSSHKSYDSGIDVLAA